MSCKYIVKPGDSLSKIAEEQLGSHRKAKELAEFNNLSAGSLIRVGQEIKLPYCTYTVKTGDTLWAIAGNSLNGARKIAEFNNININNPLSVGDTLYIPLEFATPKAIVEGNDEYIVQRGDTLTRIAYKELGESSRFQEIAKLNNIQYPYLLNVGEKLKIPPLKKSLNNQDESVRPEVKRIINNLISNKLDKENPSLENRIEIAMRVYVELLSEIPWVEGAFRHMYLDGKGLVTIGLGFNIDNKETLKKCFQDGTLTFYRGNSSTPVSDFTDVAKAYDFVKKQQSGRSGSYYYKQGENDLLIPEKQMIKVSESHLRNYVIPEIKKEFPNMDKISSGHPPPIAAIVGMIDKVYNAGMGKLKMPPPKGFPKLLEAFREGDFASAAKQSGNAPKDGQSGILKRNTLDYELFMKASQH